MPPQPWPNKNKRQNKSIYIKLKQYFMMKNTI